MSLTQKQTEEIRRVLANRPVYPDLKFLTADGHIIRRSTGYEVVTEQGFNALTPFMKSVLISNETGMAIRKLYSKRKR